MKVKYGVLSINRLKAIKNAIDFFIYLSFSIFYTQASNSELFYFFTYIIFFFKIYWQSQLLDFLKKLKLSKLFLEIESFNIILSYRSILA